MAAAKKPSVVSRIQRTESYAEKVRLMFAQTVNEILALNKTMPVLGEGEMYSFDGESMKKQKQVEALLRQLRAAATLAIQKGIRCEWEEANKECDEMIKSVFGKEILSSPTFNGWNNRNTEAMNAFLNRSDRGMNLSDRVWKATRQLRDEMEVAITIGIGEGDSAASMSRKVRQYLNDPDLMFRRFRVKIGEKEVEDVDADGKVIGKHTESVYGRKWKKKVKGDDGKVRWIDYDKDSYKDQWTGKGYYKSSAQNAMRVTRTETNIAYRRADKARWNSLDFVLGVHIEVSNHTRKGKKREKDICDKLQGDYPKDFNFDGWHPQCFCIATPILMDEEEMVKKNEAFLKGETYTPKGKKIKDYPEGFKNWVKDNEDKIINSRDRGTEPYFIRNNSAVVDDILNPQPKTLTIADKAKIRHDARTPEQIQEIKDRAAQRQQRIESERKAAEAVNKKMLIEVVQQPPYTYITDSAKLSYKDRINNIIDNYVNYFGKDSLKGKSIEAWRTDRDSKSMFDVISKNIKSYLSKSGGINRLEAINHLEEIYKAKSVNIPQEWRSEYNAIIKELNGYDWNQGYENVVNKIEYAYNMYQLGNNKAMKNIDMSMVSSKTPYQIFTEFDKKIKGFSNTIPDKDFFDRFSEFIPLYTKHAGSNCGAYYSPKYKHVIISLSDKDNIERLTNSVWYRKGLLYHEYGHAYDDCVDMRNSKELKDIFDRFKTKVNTDDIYREDLYRRVNKYMTDFDNDFEIRHKDILDLINDNKTTYIECKKLMEQKKELRKKEYGDLQEKLGAFTDSMQAAVNGHIFIQPLGHTASYFSSNNMQLAEFIAHCSENYWGENSIFQELTPQLYEEMKEFIKKYKRPR